MPDIVFECVGNNDFSLDAASGGVAAIVDVAWQIYMKSLIEDAEFVVLADEPENHLHPELQRSLLPGLMAAFPRVQFIVATHNPFMVTSVPDSNVFVLHYFEGKVHSRVLPDVDRSASANRVLMDVLGVPFPMPLWVEDRVDEIVTRVQAEKVSADALHRARAELTEVGFGHLFPDVVERLLEDDGVSGRCERERYLIKLVKRPQPEVLVENKERWTDEYAAYKRGGTFPRRRTSLRGSDGPGGAQIGDRPQVRLLRVADRAH